MNDDGEQDHLQQGAVISPLTAALAGAMSGLVSRTATAPLDILKIRLQLSPQRTTITKVFKSIYLNEGVLSFWKGNVPLSLMYVIYGSTQFGSYSIANTVLSKINNDYLNNRLNVNVHSFIVGSFAGVSSTLVSYPFDLLRTKLASNELRQFNKLGHVSREVYDNDGLMGFYKGLRPSLLSVTIYMGVMFQTYEFCKNLVRNSKKDSNSYIQALDPFCGLISGLIAKTLTFPLDLVRKRLQVGESKSSVVLLKNILRTQGLKGLFSGLSLALMKSGPTSAVSFFVYEYTVGVFSNLKTRSF